MDLNEQLSALVAAAGVPGAVAMTGGRDGVRDSAATGFCDPASGAPMQLDTIFQLASMTKAVVSVAALRLVEQGRLSLDGPIGDVLPDLADPPVIDGFDGDKARLRPASRKITLRHLLTHTSGLGYDFVQADLARSRTSPRVPGTFASIAPTLLSDPGDAWHYGISTDWVGLAVEAASGQRLDAYLADQITGPLGMTDTMFHLDADRMARLAAMQAKTQAGYVPYPLWIGGGRDAEFLSGGGGLCGTAADYMRFLRMILNGGALDGARIISAATIAELSRNQIGALRAGAMPTTMPALSLAVDNFPGQQTGWSLGFMVNPEPGPHGRSANSLAWAGIANCYYWIDPAQDVAGVVLMQYLPFADPAAQSVFAGVERFAYRA